MKWFLSRSLGILVAAALTVAGGCSDQPQKSPQSKPSGQKPGTQRIRPCQAGRHQADARPSPRMRSHPTRILLNPRPFQTCCR